MRFMAWSSWMPQSQRSEPNTSPVRHSLCTRTSTSSSPCTAPLHHGHVLLAVEHRLVDVAGEVAPLGGDAGLGDALDQLLGLAPVADELGDRDQQQVVLLAELDEVGDPGHRAVVVDDLAQHAGGVEAGHAGQVDGGLGVAGPLEHAAVGVAQREDVAGPGQVAGAGGRVDERPGSWWRGRRPRCRWRCRGGSRRCR